VPLLQLLNATEGVPKILKSAVEEVGVVSLNLNGIEDMPENMLLKESTGVDTLTSFEALVTSSLEANARFSVAVVPPNIKGDGVEFAFPKNRDALLP
jgi:hypothetical protein